MLAMADGLSLHTEDLSPLRGALSPAWTQTKSGGCQAALPWPQQHPVLNVYLGAVGHILGQGSSVPC